jgi:hypothetical protein
MSSRRRKRIVHATKAYRSLSHAFLHYVNNVMLVVIVKGFIPRGRSSWMYRFNTQLSASHAIWPANIRPISISRLLHIKVA